MKVAIMQPYFMPYIGYFSLIKHSEMFILLDEVQFIRHGWIERNRVLKQNTGWLYLQIPLEKFSRDTKIKDIKINHNIDYKSKIIAQLQPYKKTAPYYYKIIQLVEQCFELKTDSITQLNRHILESICNYLNFPKKLFIFSEMDLPIEEVNAPDEWALNICKSLKINDIEYINPIGGLSFFDQNKYKSLGINISFQQMELNSYNQKRPEFEAGLSIIDVMMFNSVSEINDMLDDFKLVN